jgi:hypothetical protein
MSRAIPTVKKRKNAELSSLLLIMIFLHKREITDVHILHLSLVTAVIILYDNTASSGFKEPFEAEL